MNFLRKHWYDLGGILSMFVIAYILTCYKSLTNFQTLMWLNLVSLFLHQLEEYRIVGTFPGMLNSVVYKSNMPDRYPLNTNTSFYINVVMGWTFYLFAALFAEKAIWLGMVTIVVSISNIIAHTTVVNIKGKTIYNAGLATTWLLFAPERMVFLFVQPFRTYCYKDGLFHWHSTWNNVEFVWQIKAH